MIIWPVGWCSSRVEKIVVTLSCHCLFFFPVSSSKSRFVGNMKMQTVLLYFFPPFNVLLVYLQGDLDQFLEAYSWCVKVFTGGLKTKKIRATKYSEKETHFPKPANPLMCELVCGCRHGGLQLGEGLLPGTVTWSLPLMWSPAITCHWTFVGGGEGCFRWCGSFQPFSISIELLLAVQTNSRGRWLLLVSFTWTWPDGRTLKRWTMDVGREGGAEKEERKKEPDWGLWRCWEEYGWLWCLETEKKKDKIP